MTERVLTIRQPWADLIMAGVKDVENRTWPVPSTLPQWWRCPGCHLRVAPEHRRHPGMGGVGHFCAVLRGTRDTADVEYDDGPFPFRLWVHAGQRAEPSDDPAWATWGGSMASGLAGTGQRGVLLGYVTVTGCHPAVACAERDDADTTWTGCSRWADMTPGGLGPYHWTLTDPQPLEEPLPLRGHLGLWTLDPGEHDGHDTDCERCAIARVLTDRHATVEGR